MSTLDPPSQSLAHTGLERLADELELDQLRNVDEGFDIFGAVDSFALVELLMTTEAIVEESDGRYVPLANEAIFDAEQSPLRSFAAWTSYIEEQRNRA